MCKSPKELNDKTDNVRTALYIRTSTLNSSSCEYQRQNLLNTLEKHPEWQLADTYFDVASSTTPLEKRSGFSAMLNDCKKGKIDLIVTKNISRFGKNIFGCMFIAHFLKSLPHPVSVFFDDENLLINQSKKDDGKEK